VRVYLCFLYGRRFRAGEGRRRQDVYHLFPEAGKRAQTFRRCSALQPSTDEESRNARSDLSTDDIAATRKYLHAQHCCRTRMMCGRGTLSFCHCRLVAGSKGNSKGISVSARRTHQTRILIAAMCVCQCPYASCCVLWIPYVILSLFVSFCFSICCVHTELISVGQRSSALDVLETVIKSKRHRQWSPILEDIVKKFLSLCTETRQPRRAREGLVQYRQITQSATQGPDSIRKVVATFVSEGESKVREAEDKAGLGADAVANLQDLEAEETPETMMISVLTGDLSDTGRADRDNYVQWLRFLWESYRTCLEVLKNNAKLEELYADTAKKTFAFCVRYKRKVEFRRLKDLLKAHLSNNQLNTTYGAPTQVCICV